MSCHERGNVEAALCRAGQRRHRSVTRAPGWSRLFATTPCPQLGRLEGMRCDL